VLSELEAARSELERRIAESSRREQEAESAAGRLETERHALEAERRSIGRRLEDELQEFREGITGRLGKAERRLREEFADGRRRGVAAKVVGELFEAAPQLAPRSEEVAEGVVEPGDLVRHRALGWSGRLESSDGERAVVAVAGKRVRCRVAELEPSSEPGDQPSPSRARAVDLPTAAAPAELLLLGRRVEEALDEVDAYLDRALAAGRSEVRVVHGHGTGRLREAIRAHLRRHPAVASFRAGAPKEGGNGATVVALRE
jgi:DNA mismatch repair protein MutS2